MKENNGSQKQKSTFLLVFFIIAIILIILPFVTTFNELLTKVIEKSALYYPIQKYVVPFFSQIIGLLLLPFGIKYTAYLNGMEVNGVPMELSWNCLGWQSLVLLGATFITGLMGNYTKMSKFECLAIGILGTFLVNVFRIAFTAILAAYFGKLFAIVFHDYFATLVTLLWLFVFWWFSYAFVLHPNSHK